MDEAESLEIYCPNCRQHVQPLKAPVNWYCPSCAWQFSEAEINRQRATSRALARQSDSRKDPPQT